MEGAPVKSLRFLKYARAFFLVGWLLLVAFAVGTYLYHPERFTPPHIAAFLLEFETAAICVYFIFSMLRGFTLLPSTPLVIAGTMLFPHQPWIVLGISLTGIVASSAMIYWLSDALGIAEFFETRKTRHVAKVRNRLEHPAGFLFVMLWAFFPLVPTDAVCYVAGSIRMNFAKFIIAVFIGELVLCSFYVFGGSGLMSYSF